MPNWCITNYHFVGAKEEIDNLHKKLTDWTSEKTIENSFGKTWLGQVADGLGVDWNSIPCRGHITYMDDQLYDTDKPGIAQFDLETETAWVPCFGLFAKLMEKEAPHCRMLFVANEPGCGVCETNDTSWEYFDEEYYVEYSLGEEGKKYAEFFGDESSDWWSKSSVEYAVRKALSDNSTPLATLVEKLNDEAREWAEDYLTIQKLEVIPSDEYSSLVARDLSTLAYKE